MEPLSFVNTRAWIRIARRPESNDLSLVCLKFIIVPCPLYKRCVLRLNSKRVISRATSATNDPRDSMFFQRVRMYSCAPLRGYNIGIGFEDGTSTRRNI